MQHAAAWGKGDDRQRIGHGLGGQGRAFKRVERDVDRRAFAGPDLFANIKHRRLVALTFADDDTPVHVDGVECLTHGVDGGLVGGLFVTATDLGVTGDGRLFRHADDVEAEVEIPTGG